MKNNLIFNNGASLALCRTDALDAPRMPGWRQWHIEATNDDAVSALNSGIVGREYESVTGRDEAGNLITETMREDLSANTVSGIVCDHRDGTVTIYARCQTELERVRADQKVFEDSLDALGVNIYDATNSAAKRLESIRTLVNKADLTEEHSLIIDMLPSFCEEWKENTNYSKGKLVQHNAVKYLIIQPVTSQAHYPPDMPNGAMLAIYKPYQGREHYNWLYGEYCEVGFTRYEGEKLYECTSDPVANVNPPSQVSSCWKLID